jgi:5-oxoprolinase (ATP-hydrolysing)
MPPDAQKLEEEGVVIVPTYLVKNNELQWETIRDLLTNARYPSRTPEENIADINAALASLRSGADVLRLLVEKEGLEKVHYYMKALKLTTHQTLQRALEKLSNGRYTATEKLDDGHQIVLKIAIEEGKILLDFTGTSPVHPFNLNANLSIVFSAVLYVLRLLCDKAIPLNEGLMKNVDIQLPTSFLNPDFEDEGSLCPAVVGGNTEVSQRLVDTLIKALGLAACSQGTMNNFLFGNKHFGYYETICGGVGAGEGFHGRSAVHQHMTNTRITDPEELEFRFPVRLQQFAVRKDSGGKGKWNGGDGIIRAIEFMDQMDITILSQHRVEAPYGLNGGEDGQTGKQYIIRSSGAREPLAGLDSAQVSAGDKVIIETPGGGGWGAV